MSGHPMQRFLLLLVGGLSAAGSSSFGQVAVFGPTGMTDGSEADFSALTVTSPIDFSGGPAPGTLIEVAGGLDDGGGAPAFSPVAFGGFTLEVAGNNNTFDDTLYTAFDDLSIGLFGGEHESATLVFPEPITAFAATFESPLSTDGVEVTLAGVEVDANPFFLAGQGQGQQFLGFTSDTPFTTVGFTANRGGETFFIANVQVGGLIPEPAGVSLLALSLAPIFGRRRR